MNKQAVVKLLRKHVAKSPSMRDWAREHGVTASYVSQVWHGHALPGAAILKALGLRKRVIYEQDRADG